MDDVDCIHLTQDGDKWRALVNTDISPEYLKVREVSWLIEELVAS